MIHLILDFKTRELFLNSHLLWACYFHFLSPACTFFLLHRLEIFVCIKVGVCKQVIIITLARKVTFARKTKILMISQYLLALLTDLDTQFVSLEKKN